VANTLVVAVNPADGTDTYSHIQFQRAADNSGVPGAFSDLVRSAIDAKNEQTYYEDTGGDDDSWYRYRYENSDESVTSNWSEESLADEHVVTNWLIDDIDDSATTTADWTRWRDEVLADFQTHALMRELETAISFDPSSDTDEWKDLTGEFREVVRVDMHDSTGKYITSTPHWYKWGRRIRITQPDEDITYKIYGVGNIRHLGDLDDDYFTTLYWGIRIRYIDHQIAERLNFKYFLNADKVSDVSLPQLEQHRQQAVAEYEKRINLHKAGYVIPAGTP